MDTARKTAMRDIDEHLRETFGEDFREHTIYSKHLDTKENRMLNRLAMKKHDKF
jgi:hypothetical protein